MIRYTEKSHLKIKDLNKLIVHGQKKSELTLYLVLWAMLYAAIAFSIYLGKVTSHASEFDWASLFSSWRLLFIFFVAFCIHNFLIAPLLVYRDKRILYGLLVAALIAVFTYSQARIRTDEPNLRNRPEMPAHEPRGEILPSTVTGRRMPPPIPLGDKPRKDPPHTLGGKDSVAFIIVCLLLGLNIGAKYYFKSSDDRKRLRELERDNLHTQLAYLKYQINPHFFMNTLNNIHALVLIDPEQANRMIETLSRLMRYVLYDGNRQFTQLKQEMTFAQNYIDLMRIRYTNNVQITVRFPESVPDTSVPPMLFATFIENAFKHGISYERKSFIEVSLKVDHEHIVFCCRNSRRPEAEDTHGGVGMSNVSKRLKLIYGKRYRLDIVPSAGEYAVTLTLPTDAPTLDTETLKDR